MYCVNVLSELKLAVYFCLFDFRQGASVGGPGQDSEETGSVGRVSSGRSLLPAL